VFLTTKNKSKINKKKMEKRTFEMIEALSNLKNKEEVKELINSKHEELKKTLIERNHEFLPIEHGEGFMPGHFMDEERSDIFFYEELNCMKATLKGTKVSYLGNYKRLDEIQNKVFEIINGFEDQE
jgi:hypothetical protein